VLETPILRRKCDFDCEIAIDMMEKLSSIDGVILFSGDGDYVALIKELIKNKKQAIVVALKNTMGKEYALIKKGVFICNVKKLKEYLM